MDNVDKSEVSKFDALASGWWDPEGDFKPLHEINPLRLNYINKRHCLNGQVILDVGCGGGLLAEGMADRGGSVTGLDAGAVPIAVAKLHAEDANKNVEYYQGTVDSLLPQQRSSFDVITCMEMLEHVPKPHEIVSVCAQLVRPGGTVFFSTINRNPKSWLFAILGAEYMLRLLPQGTHRYDRFIRPSELENWAAPAGLRLVDITGLHYNPLSRKYSIGPGVDVNYILHFERLLDDI